MDARRAFLERLIDDAGLFPPARLPMADALAAHRANGRAEHAWMLGRFLCPASRVPELLDALPGELVPLRIGVIDDGGDVVADDRLVVETWEAKTEPADAGPGSIAVYLEPPDSTDLDAAVGAVDRAAELGIGAKLRCGGQDESMHPGVEVVAAFLRRAVERGVGIKATAGLHHPVRKGREHGFLNLVGATTLLAAGAIDPAAVVEVVSDDDSAAFGLDRSGFHWRGHTADVAAVTRARRETFHAYGSCSFTEPVDDLRTLGIL